MSKFIWIRDIDKREHFVNVDHIVRATKVPPYEMTKSPGYAYILTSDGKEFKLSNDAKYDSYEDIVAKIQAAQHD